MANPPSFQPRSHTPRPSARGAKRVGTGTPPDAQQHLSQQYSMQQRSTPQQNIEPPIRRSINSSTPNTTPPSYASTASASGRLRSSVQPQPVSLSQAPRGATPPPQHRYAPGTAGAQRIPEQAMAQPPSYPRSSAPRSATLSSSAAGRMPIPSTYPRNWLKTSRRAIVVILALMIAIVAAWGAYLVHYGNSRLNHLEALSDAPNTQGSTYLIVGSDARGTTIQDGAKGQRADTIMVLHKPRSGSASLISLPRDSWVPVPDNGEAKINAAFSWGGPQLLVQTVENYTGLSIDHYVQIGMDGVKEITDAVGGVELCMSRSTILGSSMYTNADGNDELYDQDSDLAWSWAPGEEESCHAVGGNTALAFSRMRKSDATGDIGRAYRQRHVVSAILHKAFTKEILLSPSNQKALVGNGSTALTVDTHDSVITVGFAGLALKNAMGNEGLSGTPPIADMSYWTDDGQSAVLLDPNKKDQFWAKVADGSITADDFHQVQ